MRIMIAAALLSLLMGCASATIQNRNQVELGMTKDQVLALLGEPDKSNKAQHCEELVYEGSISMMFGPRRNFCVRLMDGQVEMTSEYGCGCFKSDTGIDTHLIINR